MLDPGKIEIHQGGESKLNLRVGREMYTGVRVQRLFPYTHPHRFLRFLDERGKEIDMLEEAAGLGAESRRILAEYLDRVYETRIIARVLKINSRYGLMQWRVETDRGAMDISIERDFLRVLPGGKIAFKDPDGVIYEIPDWRQLDGRSREWVEREL